MTFVLYFVGFLVAVGIIFWMIVVVLEAGMDRMFKKGSRR